MTVVSRSTLILIAGFLLSSGSAFSSSSPRRSNSRAVAGRLSSENYSSVDDVTPPNTKSRGSLFTSNKTLGPYIRIQKRGRHYDVQTAVTTFRNKSGEKTKVELHSQIHFGDESYFNYFNDENQFGSLYDKVLYELIVEDKFLQKSNNKNNNIVRTLLPTLDNQNPIAPTAADRNTASQYGLQCQVDGIQYCRENWIHADVTRQEFLNLLENEDESQTSTTNDNQQQQQQQQPLWALASTTSTYPNSEAFTALLRPLTTTTNSASVQLTRRLFTHLFLPGDALSGWIRAILWFGVPAPELSILLVDWSSLSYIGRGKRRRSQGNDMSTSEDEGIAPISPIAAPVLLSLLTGNWGTARRLVFGQVLVGGQSSEDTSKNGVLIEKRNEHAMNVLRETLRMECEKEDDHDGSAERQKRIALLYGAGHCRDLHGRLEEEGYVPVRTEWRTAFRASAPKWGDYFNVDRDFSKTNKSAEGISSGTSLSSELSQFGEGVISSLSTSALESAAVGLVVLPLYLLIGGLDWVSTLQDLGSAFENGLYLDALAGAILYLVRHVALYVGLSKFVIDWGGDNGIVEEEQ